MWLRLSQDSIKKWCGPLINGHNEAWAVQYNQHLGKTLLVPVEEPKSILDEIIKETILRRLPELMRDKGKNRRGKIVNSLSLLHSQKLRQKSLHSVPISGGPGNYHVVKCGSSGHNI